MSVQIECGWDYEASLLIFKKLVSRSGVMKAVKEREFFQTRSQRRKAKDSIAARRRRQAEERRRLYSAERWRHYARKRKEQEQTDGTQDGGGDQPTSNSQGDILL